MALTREEKQELVASKERMRAANKAYKEKLDKEPKIKIEFRNIEDPGLPVKFVLQGINYVLYDNKVTTLPRTVVEHIESLKFPIKEFMTDKDTGQITGTSIKGYKSRFSVSRLGTVGEVSETPPASESVSSDKSNSMRLASLKRLNEPKYNELKEKGTTGITAEEFDRYKVPTPQPQA